MFEIVRDTGKPRAGGLAARPERGNAGLLGESGRAGPLSGNGRDEPAGWAANGESTFEREALKRSIVHGSRGRCGGEPGRHGRGPAGRARHRDGGELPSAGSAPGLVLPVTQGEIRESGGNGGWQGDDVRLAVRPRQRHVGVAADFGRWDGVVTGNMIAKA